MQSRDEREHVPTDLLRISVEAICEGRCDGAERPTAVELTPDGLGDGLQVVQFLRLLVPDEQGVVEDFDVECGLACHHAVAVDQAAAALASISSSLISSTAVARSPMVSW